MWVVWSLVSALTLALRDVLIKLLSDKNNSFWILVLSQVFSGIIIFLYFTVIGPLDLSQLFRPDVWWIMAILLPIDLAIFTLYFLALKVSPLSVSVPMLAFTPVLLPVTSWFILHEPVSLPAFGGILLVAVGAYFLFFKKGQDILAPFRHFGREKGAVYMFIVSILFSLSGVLGRMMILRIGLANVSAFYTLILGLGMLITFALSRRISLKTFSFHRPGIWIGMILSASVMVVTHFMAMSMVNAAYMMSVKRTSLLFTLILSWIFFREKDIRQKAVAVLIMLLGVALVVLGSTGP